MRNANLPPLMLVPADRYATLGAFGSPVHHQHAQLRALLLARRRKDLADYFARPVQDDETGEIRWLSECEGELTRFDQMSQAQAQQARERLGRIQADLAGLSATLKSMPVAAQSSPGAGPAFASVLDAAQRVPDTGDFLFMVGDQPVIAFWGFRDHHGTGVIPSPVMPAAPQAAQPKPATVEPPRAAAAISETSERSGWLPWLWWLLGLLLLLLALGWWLWHHQEPAAPPEAAAVTEPSRSEAPSASNALPATQGREARDPIAIDAEALARGDLSFLQGLWQVGRGRISIYSGSPDNVTGSARDVLEFGPDGRGRHHTLEGMQHGRGQTSGPPIEPCSGDLEARIQGKALLIDLGPCITPGSGERQYAPRRFECVIAGQGATECKTANADGHRWQTDLLRIR
jgi:hypothetical protein